MFQLTFDIPKAPHLINIRDQVLLMGSCFSDEIGALMKANKFNVLSNPYGTLFNPYSILKTLRGELNQEDTLENDGTYYHWDCHSQVCGANHQEVVNKVTHQRNETLSFLDNTSWLMLTFGTAFIYVLKSNGKKVANCHKIPQKEFEKRLLSVEEITQSFHETYQFLQKKGKAPHITLTLSPVRHTRDGLIENNHSKAILLQSIHQIVEQYEEVHYFPSYEIMIDELRDYRFYAEDMIHPSQQAVNYIWEKLIQSCFDHETQQFLPQWSKIKKALEHRPFQPQSEKHQRFLNDLLNKLAPMRHIVDVTSETEQVKSALK